MNICFSIIFILVFILVAPVFSKEPDYGAEEANTTFFIDKSDLGGREDFNYLALRDHPGPSGVPLGGIGVGCFDLAPNGRFTRVGLNNTHHVLSNKASKGCFFAVWEKNKHGKRVRSLLRDPAYFPGMPGFKHSTYTGVFPRAMLSFDDGNPDNDNLKITIHAYSGVVPHNVKDSSLPVVWIDIEVAAKNEAEVSIAFSWQDFIGKGIYDPKPEMLDSLNGQILEKGRAKLVNAPEAWPLLKQPETYACAYNVGKLKGILQIAKEPIKPVKATFQNYIDHVAILVEPGRGDIVSALPAYDVGDSSLWKGFIMNGVFSPSPDKKPLSSETTPNIASAIAIKTKISAGQKKTIRFMVAWYMPELEIDRQNDHPGRYWSKLDYGRYFHNFFNSLDEIIKYAYKERSRILRQTIEWQSPILNSTLPDWLKFKLINSGYVLYTNSMLNKSGCFTVMEGAMGGLAGTMDQRISAHPFYQKFFTELDRWEMQLFGDTQDPAGFILHFIGHYYVGMAPKGGPAPTERGHMLDNTAGWILQIAKDYAQTGDYEYLKSNANRIRKGLAYLKSRCPEGVPIPVGATTYDDFEHPPIYSYMAGVYLATLKCAAYIGAALGDDQMVREANAEFERSQEAMIRMLWNGRFFAYGCNIDGSERRDDIVFTGQLAGQFISRYWGYGDIIPLDMTRAALIAKFKTSISNTPDYYANKVWDLKQMKGIDRPGSQCWPFYLESYTAMTAIQAGYLADGLDIMKHIQLVHLRKGLTWCQNLWNPGEVTYMTAPVTWFITDVIAGSNLDIPSGTLYIAPVGPIDGDKLETPIFFPKFWAVLKYEPKIQKASLKVIKFFGSEPIIITKLVSEPAGVSTSARKTIQIAPFEIKEKAVLDLSPYWDIISGAVIHDAVLPRAKEINYLTVNP